jgi:hypothetical protein
VEGYGLKLILRLHATCIYPWSDTQPLENRPISRSLESKGVVLVPWDTTDAW